MKLDTAIWIACEAECRSEKQLRDALVTLKKCTNESYSEMIVKEQKRRSERDQAQRELFVRHCK